MRGRAHTMKPKKILNFECSSEYKFKANKHTAFSKTHVKRRELPTTEESFIDKEASFGTGNFIFDAAVGCSGTNGGPITPNQHPCDTQVRISMPCQSSMI